MKRKRFAPGFAPILLLLFVFSATAEGQTLLRWKLENGQTLHYQIDEEATLGTGERGLTEKLVMETTWTVTEMEADAWQIAVSVDRIRFTASGNVGGGAFEVLYDSLDKTAKGRGAEALSELFNAIVGCKILLTLDPLGRMTDPELPKDLINQFNQPAPAELAGFFGDTVSMVGLKRALFLVAVPLPEGEVSAGNEWKHEYKLKLAQGTLTGISGVATYSHLGPESGGDASVQKLSVQSEEELLFKRRGQNQSRKTEVKGVVYFDNSNGSLTKRTSTRQQGTFLDMKTTVARIKPEK